MTCRKAVATNHVPAEGSRIATSASSLTPHRTRTELVVSPDTSLEFTSVDRQPVTAASLRSLSRQLQLPNEHRQLATARSPSYNTSHPVVFVPLTPDARKIDSDLQPTRAPVVRSQEPARYDTNPVCLLRPRHKIRLLAAVGSHQLAQVRHPNLSVPGCIHDDRSVRRTPQLEQSLHLLADVRHVRTLARTLWISLASALDTPGQEKAAPPSPDPSH